MIVEWEQNHDAGIKRKVIHGICLVLKGNREFVIDIKEDNES